MKVTKIPPETKYFVYQNPNPKELWTGDCTVRCVSIALNISWEEAYELLVEEGKRLYTVMSNMDCVEEVLKKNGFIRIPISVRKGQKRPTMRKLLAKPEYKNCVLVGRATHHVMTARDGKVRDTWNSSERPLYKFYCKAQTPK